MESDCMTTIENDALAPHGRSRLRLKRQILQRVDVRTIEWPTDDELCRLDAQQWLGEVVNEAHRLQPFPSYEQALAKTLMRRLENAMATRDDHEGDVDDVLMSTLSDAMLPADEENIESAYYWIRYSAPWQLSDECDIFIQENPKVYAAQGSTAQGTWAAALHFASILQLPEIAKAIRHKRILELGAGCGLVSLAMVQLCEPQFVCATDLDLHALERLKAAAKRSSIDEHTLAVEQLGWDDVSAANVNDWSSFDTIVATDVTYEPAMIDDLVRVLAKLSKANPNLDIIVVATVRRPDALDAFLEGCKTSSLVVDQLIQAGCCDCHNEANQMGFFHNHDQTAEYQVLSVSRARGRSTDSKG